jgi:tetratricopeptide (TPR) repeat protein
LLFAALGVLGAQGLPPRAPNPPQGDDVGSYLENLRGPAARRMELDALFRSANASVSAGRYSDAEGEFRSLMEQEQDTRGVEGVARVYFAQNRKDAALEFLQAELAHSPTRPGILFAFVRTAVKANEYDLALAALAKALDSLADSRPRADVYSRMGEVYRLKADLDSAIAAFRKARELLPQDRKIAIALAQVFDAAGREAEAAENYRAVLGVDPRDGVALLRRASVLSTEGGDLDVAAACAQLANKLSPADPVVSDTLGWTYLKQGLSERAIPLYKELVAKSLEVSTYHYRLAMALLQAGDRAGGARELETALKCNPPDDEKERIQALVATGGVRK